LSGTLETADTRPFRSPDDDDDDDDDEGAIDDR